MKSAQIFAFEYHLDLLCRYFYIRYSFSCEYTRQRESWHSSSNVSFYTCNCCQTSSMQPHTIFTTVGTAWRSKLISYCEMV